MSWYCYKKHTCDICKKEFQYSADTLTFASGTECPHCGIKYKFDGMNIKVKTKEDYNIIYLTENGILNTSNHIHEDLWYTTYKGCNAYFFKIISYNENSWLYKCKKLKYCHFTQGCCRFDWRDENCNCDECKTNPTNGGIKFTFISEGLPVTNTKKYNLEKLKKYKN